MALPYFITRDSLLEHAIIRGATGSGKTALVLSPLIDQLVGLAGKKLDSSIVVIDLKGDNAFFQGARLSAEAAGLPFRWFTTTLGKTTYGLNPFLQKHLSKAMSTNQVAEMFVRSFGLDVGDIYGGSYFRDMALLYLRAVLHPEIQSFHQLFHDYVKKGARAQGGKVDPLLADLPRKAREDTTHLQATLEAFAQNEALNVTPQNSTAAAVENAIDLGDVLSTPQVLYFYLSSPLEGRLTATIGKIVSYLLLTAASMRTPEQQNKVYLVVDEFQRIVGPDFTIFLEQARGFGIGTVMATQTTSHLKTAAGDYTEVIEENTNVKIDLTASSLSQRERIEKESPQLIAYGRNVNVDGEVSLTERVQHQMSPNDATSLTANRFAGIVRVSSPAGLTQCGGNQVSFVPMFHISGEEYSRRQKAPWPGPDVSGTFVVKDARKEKPAAAGKPDKKTATKKTTEKPADSGFQTKARRVLRDDIEEGEN